MTALIPDPLDQPEDPRIRTKTNRLDAATDLAYFQLVNRLRIGDLDIDSFQARCLAFFTPLVMQDHFAAEIEEAWQIDGQLELLRRHIDHCRYTVLFYRVDEHEVHPPHHHFNVASTQIIVAGKIRIREYDRVRRTRDGTLFLNLVSDRMLCPGDSFQASEWNRNVHWFQAVDGPAMIFNTNVRGFEEKTFDADEGNFGRRYLDPTSFGADGIIRCEEFDEAEAQNRFQKRPLDDFEVPLPVRESLRATETS